MVENPLALRLLEGEFGEGDTVRVEAVDGELVFEKAERARRGGVARRACAHVDRRDHRCCERRTDNGRGCNQARR